MRWTPDQEERELVVTSRGRVPAVRHHLRRSSDAFGCIGSGSSPCRRPCNRTFPSNRSGTSRKWLSQFEQDKPSVELGLILHVLEVLALQRSVDPGHRTATRRSRARQAGAAGPRRPPRTHQHRPRTMTSREIAVLLEGVRAATITDAGGRLRLRYDASYRQPDATPLGPAAGCRPGSRTPFARWCQRKLSNLQRCQPATP